QDSTLIVLRNKIRCKLSVPLAAASCARHGVTHFVSRARDNLIKDSWSSAVPTKWPAGLRQYLQQLEDNKTEKLPWETSVSVGMKVTLRLSQQFTGVSVCNNSAGTIIKIVLDSREQLDTESAGPLTVALRRPPAYVLVHVQEADKRGLKLDGLPPGVVAI
ncbi:unnamed protein product, partial [Scytosiphon promiscuus]